MSTVLLRRSNLAEELELALGRLNVAPDSLIKFEVNAGTFVITPVGDANRSADLRSSIDKVKNRYSTALENLAK